ncbi:MAG TPA: hypothetical protein VFR93_01205 [Candidatus Limnocylindrales bacterium]|nr:hypothetical protein [Candidatus Limnocylindrales bacterium]
MTVPPDRRRASPAEPSTAEERRLDEARRGVPWRRWGPYLSERQWGTVREDYSPNGDAWSYLSHDQARSRAYRWGEDGLAGISDEGQRLCFAIALWNGRDPILKERIFGLTNAEGNHGEDAKEYWFYLDSTPTHSYMRWLYKYPQAPFPYEDLVRTNAARGRSDFEYELLDTGAFDEDRYFDVVAEYAKASPDDLLVRISATNRGPDAAPLHLLPTLWFRNTWSWEDSATPEGSAAARPTLRRELGDGGSVVLAADRALGDYALACDGAPELLFTENETNAERLFGSPNRTPWVKDAFHRYVVDGRKDAVNPEATGTKAAAHYAFVVAPGETAVVRLRLSGSPAPAAGNAEGDGSTAERPAGPGREEPIVGRDFDTVIAERRAEADEFYAGVIPASVGPERGAVMRQALAGMLWSKQFYAYDVDRWLGEHGFDPFAGVHRAAPRNAHWQHLTNADVVSMPDKWEYPWYAAWDLAFHVLALTLVDEDFGKAQLELVLRDEYLHPNGQLPAYEWNFGDVNPPVHAWATIFTYRLEQARRGEGDLDWLERIFGRLLLNFTWWVNRKDRTGSNLFEGGFLGLDNIGVFDRSSALPTGGYLEQADGTAWMALFCQNMTEIAVELALHRPALAEMVQKFVTHFLWIASAMMRGGDGVGMWDEEDGFFYDVLRLPDGSAQRLKVRSMVGLLPLCAVTVFEGELYEVHPEIADRLREFITARPELRQFIHDPVALGVNGRRMGAILDEPKLRRVLARMLDEEEFLGEYGIRSLSRFHADHPYEFWVGGDRYVVSYLPAESDSGMFGGNSNWRGPIWMPVNALIIRALLQYYAFYGDDFRVECPTGSGRLLTLYEVAEEIARRLTAIFVPDADGRRPVYGGTTTFQEDPNWRDHLLFFEYFHGDNGAGLGASHQTGWTGLIARAIHLFATMSAEDALAQGKRAAAAGAVASERRNDHVPV